MSFDKPPNKYLDEEELAEMGVKTPYPDLLCWLICWPIAMFVAVCTAWQNLLKNPKTGPDGS